MLSKEQIQVLGTVAPKDGFRYFSGHCPENSHNLPAIYAISHKFYVVGPGYEIECKNFDEAVKEYIKTFRYLI